MSNILGQISFGPLLHNTLGFDEAFKEFDKMMADSRNKQFPTFPPHNIYKYNDNSYVVELAVAGFSRKALDVTVEDGHLIIRGTKLDIPDNTVEYVHKGISNKSFTKKLKLLDTIKVTGAEYVDGILRIQLENYIPEKKKPIKIEIGDCLSPPQKQQLLTE